MRTCLILTCLGLNLSTALAVETTVSFERQVAPIFAEHCAGCHSPSNSKGGVSLDRINDLRDNGYFEPGRPDESHLMDLIAGVGGNPPEMPKDAKPLSSEQVALIRQWIAEGAEWPKEVVVREPSKADASWWSLQPIKTEHGDVIIDDFVEAELARNDLKMNPPADRRTLIRRATYDLIGLPPTPSETEAFVSDTDPHAYAALIDRLLESPHYGERWGRHWLDVVRFGESIGYERNVIVNNIWPFRDYVIRSLNEDKPFDQFIREHLAGDVFGADDPDTAIGSAFLVAGPYDDVGNQDADQAAQIRANTLDEIISATGQAFLGLTLGCARCHDHKFDPIRQSDYYALYATFSGIRHGSVTLATPDDKAELSAKLEPLHRRQAELKRSVEALRTAVLARAQARLEEYEIRWTRPPVDRRETAERFQPVRAKFVRLICEARDSDIKTNTGFGVDEFEIWSVAEGGMSSRNVALATSGAQATGRSRHIEDFPDAYSPGLAIDGKVGARFIAAGNDLTIELAQPTRIDRVVFSSARGADTPRQGKFAFVAEYRIEVSSDGKKWEEVAHGRDRKPTDFASNPTHEEYRLLRLEISDQEKAEQAHLEGQLRDVEREISKVPRLPSVWIGTRNTADAKGPFHVFLGGSPKKKGDEVVPRSLSVLDGENGYHLEPETPESERRNALARWITNKSNPLTPRVLANRVWQYHFGTGIVDTPSDFGYMGGRPTHPELLDFLASKLISHNWRLKPLHRMIMTSKSYRQSSGHRKAAGAIDGDARLLWRFPPRRLSAEEIRDTVLMIAGKIENQSETAGLVPDGGPGFRLYHFMQDNVCTYVPLDVHGPATFRRAVYHQNARASVVDLMTDFDQPDCTFSAPKRSETTTPLQALTMLNHKFTLDMAESMAKRLRRDASDDEVEQISWAFQLCFGRRPTTEEAAACVDLVDEHGLSALCRVLLNTSELIYVR